MEVSYLLEMVSLSYANLRYAYYLNTHGKCFLVHLKCFWDHQLSK